MLRRSLAILLLLSVACASSAITPGEQSAIRAVLKHFPDLEYHVLPQWSADRDPCAYPPFYGITCSNGTDPHILGLHLNNSDLSGNFDGDISGFQWIESISLTEGCFGRVLPESLAQLPSLTSFVVVNASPCRSRVTYTEIIGNLTSLVNLTLQSVPLMGTLPSSIGALASLRTLSITYPGELLTGDLPYTIGHLTELRVLQLAGVRFKGLSLNPSSTPASLPYLDTVDIQSSSNFHADISPLLENSEGLRTIIIDSSLIHINLPTVSKQSSLIHLVMIGSEANWHLTDQFWRAFPNLRVLRIHSPFVTGTIGSDIGTMTSLHDLDLHQVKLTGTLPAEVGGCPLKSLKLTHTSLQHPFPNVFDRLSSTLEHLKITDIFGSEGTLPSTIGELKLLNILILSQGGFYGTIPSSFGDLPLIQLELDSNALTGTIPEFRASTGFSRCILNNNRLTGTIPASLTKATSLHLSHNQLGPTIPHDLRFDVINLRIAHNRFSGPLPVSPITSIDFSHNEFSGTIPSNYSHSLELDLSHNKLSGDFAHLLDTNSSVTKLLLHNNEFAGTIPAIDHPNIQTISLSHNNFSGTLPLLPAKLMRFEVAHNPWLTANNFKQFAASVVASRLEYLDLSGIGLSGFSVYSLTSPTMKYLILADNGFNLDDPPPSSPLLSLDITNNNIASVFASNHITSLVVLKASHNQLYGSFLDNFKSLSELDISHNSFAFDVVEFQSLPLLTNINAHKNALYGSLTLKDMPDLQYADFSSNSLNLHPDMPSIGSLFEHASLKMLNISDNPHLPRYASLESNLTSLVRTSLSTPSSRHPKSVTCYRVAFATNPTAVLDYDESLFSYDQCDCNEHHFGSPSMHCIKCPSTGVSSCGGAKVNVSSNHFSFMLVPPGFESPITSEPTNSLDNLIDSLWSSLNHVLGLAAPSPPVKLDPNDFSVLQLETETCLVTTVQTLSGRSNCAKGLVITHEDVDRSNMSIANLLKPQCNIGSEGRLCSRCSCNTTAGGECWYLSGPACSKCRRVFSLSSSLLVAALIVLVVFLFASFLMKVALEKKRVWTAKRFDDLPLTRRIFYRLVYLISLGNVSILITFVQILLGITEWDANVKVGFLGVINGSPEGLGLQCFFPFLSDPLWALLMQLSIPFVALILLAGAVAVGSGVIMLMDARKKKKLEHLDCDSGSGDTPLLLGKPDEIAVHYPAAALLVTLSITIVKFFYFGTALAAHEYLFSTQQAITGHRYIQSKPWMRSSEAWPLVKASIPAVLIFDLVIPVSFLVICWKVRHIFYRPSVQIYCGSLFETYNGRCFWWEIVNTLKKLALALVLKGFPATDALQGALVTSILAGVMMIQVSLSPWRRKAENLADTASSLLLIFAFVYTRPTNFTHAPAVVWYAFALSIVFIVVCAGIVGWQAFFGTTDYERKYQDFINENELQTQHTASGLSDWDMNSGSEAADGSFTLN